MRLLYLSLGQTIHDLRFISSLVKTNVEVKWLRLGTAAKASEVPPESPFLEVVHWRGEDRAYRLEELSILVPSLEAMIRQLRPDMLHAGPVQSCAYLASLTGFKPLVTLSFGYDLLKDAESSVEMLAATRATLDRTTLLMVDCDAVRHKAQELGFSGRPVVQFAWGVDLHQFSPGDGAEIRNRLGFQDAFMFLSLRTLEPLYGVDVVLKGFLWAAARHRGLRLAILGSGSQEAWLKDLAAASPFADRIHFGGRVSNEELPRWYRAADCYVSASPVDGSSVSLLEAMACAKPSIVTDIPGNREWVEEGIHGWRFPVGDPAALAEIMLAAAAHPDLAALGAAARKRAEEKADWSENFKVMLSAYRQAVKFSSPWTVA